MQKSSHLQAPRRDFLMLAVVAGLAVPAAAVPQSAAAQDAEHAERDNVVAGPPQRLLQSQTWRGHAEFALIYSTAVGMYYFDGREHQNDRDFSESFARIVSPARWRFDDNEFNMNNVAHPFGGLLYYGAPRQSGASAGRSFLTLLLASVFWEQVVEMREVASINDHIQTPISGWALGEAAFQARTFFRRSEPTLMNRALAALFGFPFFATEPLLRRPQPVRALSWNERGYAADVDHRFRFHTGATTRSSPAALGSGVQLEAGFAAEVQNVGVRAAAGSDAGWTGAVAGTAVEFDVAVQDGAISEWRFGAGVLPAAWHHRSMRSAGGSGATGHSLLLGPAAAFHVHQLGSEGRLWMRRIAVYNLGPRADLVVSDGATRARLVLDAAPNFANVTPTDYAYPRVQMAGESTVLLRRNYYHGWGASGQAALTLSRGPFELSARARQDRVLSLDARDRVVEDAFAVQPKWDHWTDVGMTAAWRATDGLELSLGRQQRSWRGSLLDGHEHADAMRLWRLRVAAAM